jgi:hypothetical protein
LFVVRAMYMLLGKDHSRDDVKPGGPGGDGRGVAPRL